MLVTSRATQAGNVVRWFPTFFNSKLKARAMDSGDVSEQPLYGGNGIVRGDLKIMWGHTDVSGGALAQGNNK